MPRLAIDLFAGLGGVTSAFAKAGFSTVSVEGDPSNMGFSTMMGVNHRRNFPTNSKFILQPVQEFAAALDGFNPSGKLTILHGSPSCRHFTIATRGMIERPVEDEGDRTAAISLNKTIAKLDPDYFTMEQVPDYQTSESYRLAIAGLRDTYYFQTNMIDLSNYGIPQSRKRFFIYGWKKDLKSLKLPPVTSHKGWFSTLDGLTCKQVTLPREAEHWVVREPMLLPLNKKVSFERSRSHHETFLTILRSHFVDQRGNFRSTSFRYVHNGICYVIPLRAIARGQGFFDDFLLPSMSAIAGQGLGNAFSPSFYHQFLSHNGISGL